jgi:hypothetical protein
MPDAVQYLTLQCGHGTKAVENLAHPDCRL